jgi:hypothetical protein
MSQLFIPLSVYKPRVRCPALGQPTSAHSYINKSSFPPPLHVLDPHVPNVHAGTHIAHVTILHKEITHGSKKLVAWWRRKSMQHSILILLPLLYLLEPCGIIPHQFVPHSSVH